MVFQFVTVNCTYFVKFKSSLNPSVWKVSTVLLMNVENSMNETLRWVDGCLKLCILLMKSLMMMPSGPYRRRSSLMATLYIVLCRKNQKLLYLLVLLEITLSADGLSFRRPRWVDSELLLRRVRTTYSILWDFCQKDRFFWRSSHATVVRLQFSVTWCLRICCLNELMFFVVAEACVVGVVFWLLMRRSVYCCCDFETCLGNILLSISSIWEFWSSCFLCWWSKLMGDAGYCWRLARISVLLL